MITAQDLKCLATYLVENHGTVAVDYADRAVGELEAKGEWGRADAWKALRSVVVDLVDGRLDAEAAIVLH